MPFSAFTECTQRGGPSADLRRGECRNRGAAGLLRPSTRLASANPRLHNRTSHTAPSAAPSTNSPIARRYCEIGSASAAQERPTWRAATGKSRRLGVAARCRDLPELIAYAYCNPPCLHSYVTQSISATLH